MGDLLSPLTFSALSEPPTDVSRKYRREDADTGPTSASVLDALRQKRDPSKVGAAAEPAPVSARPHVGAPFTISLADVNAAIAKNAVQAGEAGVPRDFGRASERVVHEATSLRQAGDHWVSSVKSTREVGAGDVLEVVTRGDRPARLAAVVDHVVGAVRDERGWTQEVAHRLVNAADVQVLLAKYPAAGTNSCVRLELRARTAKLPTATSRDAKLGASLLASDTMRNPCKDISLGLPAVVHVVERPSTDRVQIGAGGSYREHEQRNRVSQTDPSFQTRETIAYRPATATMFDGTKVRIEVRSTAGSWHGVRRSDTQALTQAVLVELDNGQVIRGTVTVHVHDGWFVAETQEDVCSLVGKPAELNDKPAGVIREGILKLCGKTMIDVDGRAYMLGVHSLRLKPESKPPRASVHDEIQLSPSTMSAANLDRIAEIMGAAPCSTCMGAKVLRHIDPAYADEPCPDCPPEVAQGPSEWTLIKETVTLKWAADESTRIVRFAKLDRETAFQITALDRATWAYHAAGPATDHPVMQIEGECCPDMMIARLLVALRDGTVKP